MALWRLQPLDPADPSWEASSHRGVVIVRAPDEETARAEAQRAFGVKTRFSPGAGVKAPPWLRPALVAAEPIHDPRYDEDGPSEILDPSFTLENP
jgi:hypothetical protein